MSSHSHNGEKSPPYFITEPLRSFSPIKLENGDLRMAIAKAEQSAYNAWGDKATLTEEFLSRDYKTWEGGLVSINHEPNQPWVKAVIHDLEYDSEKQLVICSFSGIPDWLSSLIYSADYRGLSQECVPIEMRKNSMDVVKGYGTGVTIVTDPYEPAANQGMGVGIPPALAAILQSKYPVNEDKNMVDKPGDGKPVVSVEAFESTVSENVQLKSTIKVLESDNKKLGEELASTRKEFDQYKSGETDRVKTKIEEALRAYDAQVKADEARAEVVRELKSVMKEEDAETVLSTNPSIETIKSFVAIRKVELSKGVGSSLDSSNDDNSEDVFRLVSELRGTRQVVR